MPHSRARSSSPLWSPMSTRRAPSASAAWSAEVTHFASTRPSGGRSPPRNLSSSPRTTARRATRGSFPRGTRGASCANDSQRATLPSPGMKPVGVSSILSLRCSRSLGSTSGPQRLSTAMTRQCACRRSTSASIAAFNALEKAAWPPLAMCQVLAFQEIPAASNAHSNTRRPRASCRRGSSSLISGVRGNPRSKGSGNARTMRVSRGRRDRGARVPRSSRAAAARAANLPTFENPSVMTGTSQVMTGCPRL